MTDYKADRIFPLDRRKLLTGLGAAALAPAWSLSAAAQARPSLALQARDGAIALRSGMPDSAIWTLGSSASGSNFRFKRGDTIDVSLENGLPIPAMASWRGLDGVAPAAPLTARAPLSPRAKETLAIPLRHAGTLLCDLRLLGDGQARPSPTRAMIVGETEPVVVDRDEVFLIEDWRLRPDGSAISPGQDAGDAAPIYTVNGLPALDIAARPHQRLRLRFINGCQRTGIAVKIENHEAWVMAIDGQPAEPFKAREGVLVLAPGTRIDTFVDSTAAPGSSATIQLHDGKSARPIARLVTSGEPARSAPLPAAAPLPSNGLPARLDLKSALRVDLALGGPGADWVAPANFASSAAPAFRAKAGRVVVLALTNRAATAAVFHLHGHHFRLLDRLDDGWKPFWLDTLAIDTRQTQRIAFAAEHAGRWLLESVATDWAAPRLVRWYSVE